SAASPHRGRAAAAGGGPVLRRTRARRADLDAGRVCTARRHVGSPRRTASCAEMDLRRANCERESTITSDRRQGSGSAGAAAWVSSQLAAQGLGLCLCLLGLLPATKFAQCVPLAAPSEGVPRVKEQGLLGGGESVLWTPQAVQRNRLASPGEDVLGVELKRPLVGGQRL